MADNDIARFACLNEELKLSQDLLTKGFGHLQEIDVANDSYMIPQLLLANGFERLFKCYIAAIHKGREGEYPDNNKFRSPGHNLERLLNEICTNYFAKTDSPIVREDYEFVKNDCMLNRCMKVLTQFGTKAKYHNLDFVSGVARNAIDPKREWEKLEREVDDPIPSGMSQEHLDRGYYSLVNSKLIGRMERLIRAIAMQFTCGEHPDPRGELKRLSISYMGFLALQNDDFGTTDYRRSGKRLKGNTHVWIKRSESEISKSGHPSLVIRKQDSSADWPFYDDQVIIECRKRLFCIVNIRGHDFALNGLAKSKFGLPDVHYAGFAEYGKSVYPFVKMALELHA